MLSNESKDLDPVDNLNLALWEKISHHLNCESYKIP